MYTCALKTCSTVYKGKSRDVTKDTMDVKNTGVGLTLTNYPLEWQEQRHVLFTVCAATKRWNPQRLHHKKDSALTSFLFIRKKTNFLRT